MTAEFADVSVGSARLPGGREEAKSWNHVIVRRQRRERLMELARSRGVLQFRDVPDGNLEKLKKASVNKKRGGAEKLRTVRS
jgi:coenzyme F420 hydrogenase subunit beta